MATKQSVMLVIRAARPSFRNCQDKAAFAVHAAFMAAGYSLHLTGLPAFEDGVLSSCPVADEVGMENWNEIEDYYAFVYSHPQQGCKRVVMKGLVLNKKLFVDALKEGDSEELHHLEVDTMEYVENDGGTSYGSQFKNLAKLVADVNKELLSKLNGSSVSTANSPSQPTVFSTTTNTSLGYQIPYPCPHCLGLLPAFTWLPNPWCFVGRPAAGTMLDEPYPRYMGEIWLPPPLRTLTHMGRARGRGGRSINPEVWPRLRPNMR
ncbi:probable proteasome inhibitor [Primulina eburnea]|uniref:probable proteasome inhibitor n=1 Tax=Primulina eburnea TaxID=1245227 RepID=UPI003C6C5604